jgi:hypothetical protein
VKVIIRRGIVLRSHPREPLEHDQSVARATAQALRPREEIHQRRIVLGACLDGPPREVVERLVVLPFGRVERELATLMPFLAIDLGAGLILNVKSENQKRDMKGHHQAAMPSYPERSLPNQQSAINNQQS